VSAPTLALFVAAVPAGELSVSSVGGATSDGVHLLFVVSLPSVLISSVLSLVLSEVHVDRSRTVRVVRHVVNVATSVDANSSNTPKHIVIGRLYWQNIWSCHKRETVVYRDHDGGEVMLNVLEVVTRVLNQFGSLPIVAIFHTTTQIRNIATT
jgi:hypothetical protein